jgi:predicted phage-related endonuclease
MSDLMASVDGITINGSIAFEHKLFNLRLHDSVSKGILPKEYEPQCQQIMMVTGASKLIFVCSDGTEEKIAQMELMPDNSYFKKLLDGWMDFKIDLENYGNKGTINGIS